MFDQDKKTISELLQIYSINDILEEISCQIAFESDKYIHIRDVIDMAILDIDDIIANQKSRRKHAK